MILVDYTGVAIASIMANLNDLRFDDPSLFRHILLVNLKHIRNKFKNRYGEMVLCLDQGSSWRRQHFPYYKLNRRKNREADENIDWKKIFEYMNLIFNEIKENIKFKCISIDGAEADDIMAVLALEYKDTKHVVVSNDKDMAQLKAWDHIDVYSSTKQEMVHLDDPHFYLFEHVVRGDVSDGIPNIKSQDDSFASKIRQKSIFAKDVNNWYRDGIPEEHKENFERNKLLISLIEIPENLKNEIIAANQEYVFPRSNILNYFIKNKLKNLMEDLTSFT